MERWKGDVGVGLLTFLNSNDAVGTGSSNVIFRRMKIDGAEQIFHDRHVNQQTYSGTATVTGNGRTSLASHINIHSRQKFIFTYISYIPYTDCRSTVHTHTLL
jgi:hypothetical protein